MKKIGLVGGTGPESTLIYYRSINQMVNRTLGGNVFPELAVESVNMYKAVGFVTEKSYDALEMYLWEKIEHLLACDCEILALTANTMHIVYDRLKARLARVSDVPLVGMPESACAESMRRGFTKVGLLGTVFAMRENFCKDAFTESGISVAVPDEESMCEIQRIIADELEFGIVKESSREKLLAYIAAMVREQGIEAVILGCTELPLVLTKENCPVPAIDIVEAHISRLVSMSLS